VHWIFPILGAAAFVPPLYYQYFPLPAYPIRYANWIAIGWLAAGVILTAVIPRRILANTEHFFGVEEETGEPEGALPAPVGTPASEAT
jgi:hypothetical protein